MRYLPLLFLLGCQVDADPAEDETEADAGAVGGEADGSPTEALDASPPDAIIEVDAEVDAEANDEGCAEACARIEGCVAEVCETPPEGAALQEACITECAGNPSFVPVATGVETCRDLVAFAEQTVGEPLSSTCTLDRQVPDRAVCETYATRFVECFIEACPPAARDQELHVYAWTDLCLDEVAAGRLDARELGILATPDTPCEAQLFTNAIDRALVDRPGREGDGTLAQYCQEGRLRTVDECQAACAEVAPCIPPDNEQSGAYNDPRRCEHLCLVGRSPLTRAWLCAADAAGARCETVLACFQPVEVPECATWGQRATDCTVDRCEALSEVSEGLAVALDAYCDRATNDGRLDPELVRGTTAETPCDDPAVAPIVTFIVEQDPDIMRGCEEGLLHSRELCAEACAVFAGCEVPSNPLLSDPHWCEYVCALEGDLPENRWQCVIDNGICPEALDCFQN